MRILVSALILIAALAACGGGSSGGTGLPVLPTSAPQTTYTAQIRFVGTLAGAQVQSALRSSQLAEPMGSSATPIPIMVVSPMNADGTIAGTNVNVWGGNIQVVVSPAPTASVGPVTIQNTNPDANVQATPSPAPSTTPQPLPTGVVAVENVMGNGSAVNAQAAGTVSASVTTLNASASAPVYAYRAIALDCNTPLLEGSSPGWQYNGSAWVAVSDPSTADIYLTGPSCPGAYQQSTADGYPQLHVAGGATTFSTDTPFSGLTASQWVDTASSFDMETMDTLNPDGSFNGIVLGKTAGGAVFKLFPLGFGPSPGEYEGAVEVSGAGVDGF